MHTTVGSFSLLILTPGALGLFYKKHDARALLKQVGQHLARAGMTGRDIRAVNDN
jgi:hypothetical protein